MLVCVVSHAISTGLNSAALARLLVEFLSSLLKNESSVGPVSEVFARAVTGVHGNDAEHPSPRGNLDIETPGGRQDAHHGAGGCLFPVDKDFEHDAGILREVRAVAHAHNIFIGAGEGHKAPVFRFDLVNQLTRSMRAEPVLMD